MHLQIDKNAAMPVYYQIAQQIKQYIEDESLQDGDGIPSERELCEASGVSRMTVRQAIDQLVEEGILERQRGKGTFVTTPKFSQPLSQLTSFTMDTQTRGMRPTSRVISCAAIPATPMVARMLGLEVGQPVVQLARVRLADGEPHAYECSHLNYEMAKPLLGMDLTNQSLYKALNTECNMHLTKAKETIEASACAPDIAALLDIPPRSVTFHITRTTLDDAGLPVEYVESNYRIDKFRFEVELDLVKT